MAGRALSPGARPSRLVTTTSVMRQTRVRFGSLEDMCGAKALSALGQKQTYAAQRLALVWSDSDRANAAVDREAVRSEPSWSSPLPFRAYPNRSCGPLSAATLSKSQLRNGR